ncbi:MAG: class I SAM-dependent methyltransferase [bacterium]|nr:class I SAM-dependent methyltransferase [bacterium]
MSHPQLPEYFYELFNPSLPRLGPGSDECTKRALDLLGLTNAQPVGEASEKMLRILDVGCGNGTQTIQLAKHLNGSILAVDNHQPFLDELKHRANIAGVFDKIQLRLEDMCDLKLAEGSLDLIWSESSIFIIGFEQGLKSWRKFLAQGGMMGVSEMCWLRSDPPAECVEFIDNVYPTMMSIEASLETITRSGYDTLSHFTFPESAWWDSLYTPLEERLKVHRKMYFADNDRMALINAIQAEIDNFRKYSEYYGYEFFLIRKSDD